MALFVAKEGEQEIFSRLREIATAIQPFSDRKLIVRYEGPAVMGEGTPFYHISYPVSILDRRHPLNPFTVHLPRVAPTILSFDPHSGSYKMNQYLADEVKEAIRQAVSKLGHGTVSETLFVD